MGNWSDYILKLFQSTLPRRERLLVTEYKFARNGISIHTPTKGATFTEKFISNFINYFNLHSHEGSDTSVSNGSIVDGLFQSTLPRRERHLSQYDSEIDKSFQSTLPRRERQVWFFTSTSYCYFNPHSHEGSDSLLINRGSICHINFNPHSHEGSDF